MTKRLIIRLSSLGDVILATSALSALGAGENHWVVAREYAGLLRGNPKLQKVWEFDRAQGGLLEWLSLCGELWNQEFSEIYDLHSTLRSRIAFLYFWVRGKFEHRQFSWKTVSKERIRLNGLFWGKRLWPLNWYPSPLVERFSKLVGGTGTERPNLLYLAAEERSIPDGLKQWIAKSGDYLCVMPSSKWDGKKWSVRGFYEVIAGSGLPAVILGQKSDRESALLVKILEQSSYPHISGIGELGFGELAFVLSRARAFIGNDTGLGHLAEAVGTGVVTVFGPTTPEMGFGPWRSESRAVGVDLWCKPCGKDGRFCFRFKNRYACQKNLKPGTVARELHSFLSGAPSSNE